MEISLDYRFASISEYGPYIMEENLFILKVQADLNANRERNPR